VKRTTITYSGREWPESEMSGLLDAVMCHGGIKLSRLSRTTTYCEVLVPGSVSILEAGPTLWLALKGAVEQIEKGRTR
jgi:hypothetical protein